MEGLRDHFNSRWGKPKYSVGAGSKYRAFFSELADTLKCDEQSLGQTLIAGTIVDFIRCLPLGTQSRLRKAAQSPRDFLHDGDALRRSVYEALEAGESSCPVNYDVTQDAEDDREDSAFFPVWTRAEYSRRLMKDGLKARFIDQSLYYQRPESVSLWFDITNSLYYDGFEQCKTGIARLTRSDLWRGCVRAASCDGAVMLGGGGSPTKDFIILRSLLEIKKDMLGERKLRFTLVDTSFYMLSASRRELEKLLPRIGARDRVDLRTLECDMMALRGTSEIFRSNSGNLIWFLTGGTLGNLDEERFFRSVASQARRGDWLVVGVGCVSGTPTADVLRKLEQEYQQEEIKRLVKVPLEAVWTALDKEGTVAHALERIVVEARANVRDEVSVVPGTVSVVAKINVDGFGDVKLFKSNRYTEAGLTEFGSNFGWEHLGSFEGLDDTFKQLVFRFVGEGERNTVSGVGTA